MNIFDLLTMIGGLCLFLFGMNIMGDALERRAGGGLKKILAKLTKNKLAGFLTGLGVTAIIQSSSATTVMVVGFVNSGIMTLRQSIGVIMGANIGTTVTAWILSLGGISGDNLVLQLLKPTSFTPVLALIGTVFLMFGKTSKKKDTGSILLGFATLMFGMDTMSDAVSGLAEVEAFRQMFIMFQNPILGVVAGAVLTAIIQSSSASVGILQALSSTGQVTFGAAVPIIMGQNIGTCITAILSSFGTNKNAKRAAIVHLSFNVIGTIIWLSVYGIVSAVFKPVILNQTASYFGIAVAHSLFNVACTILLLPMSSLLEKLATKLVPDSGTQEQITQLDDRLLATPPVAVVQAKKLANDMALCAKDGLIDSLNLIFDYSSEKANAIREMEDKADKYEDMLGTYLVKLSSENVNDEDSHEISNLLHCIGDFERISDHSVNIVKSVEEIVSKSLEFSDDAIKELTVVKDALTEILEISYEAFINENLELAKNIEPLEQIIDKLKMKLRNNHILRLKQNRCTIETGFVYADLVTNFERVADHCSNIGVCLIEVANGSFDTHEYLNNVKHFGGNDFSEKYEMYKSKYAI